MITSVSPATAHIWCQAKEYQSFIAQVHACSLYWFMSGKSICLAHFVQALQYKTQATQAQLKAQQEAEARKRIEAEAQAVAARARMSEKPRVSPLTCF